jgi:hypothetical protein
MMLLEESPEDVPVVCVVLDQESLHPIDSSACDYVPDASVFSMSRRFMYGRRIAVVHLRALDGREYGEKDNSG